MADLAYFLGVARKNTVGGYHIISPKVPVRSLRTLTVKGLAGHCLAEGVVCAVTDATYSFPKENAGKVEVIFSDDGKRAFVSPKDIELISKKTTLTVVDIEL